MNAKQVRNNEDNFDSDTYDRYENRNEDRLDLAGLDFEDVNTFLGFQSVTVVDASFNQSDVTDELEDNDFEEDTDHEGYTIFLHENEYQAVGVSGGALVYGRENGENDAVEVIEAAVNTKKGNEDRYESENEDFDELTSTMSTGTFMNGRTMDTDSDQVAAGASLSVNGSTSTIETVSVFEDADAIDQDQVDQYEEDAEDADNIENFSTSTNGRVLTISYDVDTDIIGTEEFRGFGY